VFLDDINLKGIWLFLKFLLESPDLLLNSSAWKEILTVETTIFKVYIFYVISITSVI